MHTIAVLGAGDLGATVARRLAERGLCRCVLLVDTDEGRAKGKALDLMQSGPVEGYDVVIEVCADLAGVSGISAVVLADHPDVAAGASVPAGPALLDAAAPALADDGVMLLAIAEPGRLL